MEGSGGGSGARRCGTRWYEYGHDRPAHGVRSQSARQDRGDRRPRRRRRADSAPTPNSRPGRIRLAHVLTDLGAGPGSKIAWCGQNSTGIVEAMNAARKIRATAVPINYRLSDDEAAYVVDHCDAVVVVVDAEFAATVRPHPAGDPQGVGRSSCSTAPPLDGMELGRRRLIACRADHRMDRAGRPRRPGRRRRHDDLHVGYDRQAERRVPPQRRRSPAGAGARCSSSATGSTTCTSRPARCTTPGPAASWPARWRWARRSSSSTSSTRRTGCASSTRTSPPRRSAHRRRSG